MYNAIIPLGEDSESADIKSVDSGDNSPRSGEDARQAQNTQSGTKGKGGQSGVNREEKELPTTMKLSEIIEHFTEETFGLKESTKHQYINIFYRFLKHNKLVTANLDGKIDLTEKIDRNKLRGESGRQYILSYLKPHPLASWRTLINHIKSVYDYGLELEWPMKKRDTRNLPDPEPKTGPKDDVVKKWAIPMQHEPDPYIRLEWQFPAHYGLRSSHIRKLRWRNIQYDGEGKPFILQASGRKEDFKTQSPVNAYIFPDVKSTLIEWQKLHPNPQPDELLLPFRTISGKIILNKPSSEGSIRQEWKRIEKKLGLPHITPHSMRHWVADKMEQVNLSYPASCGMMGHKLNRRNMQMRDWYANKQPEDIIEEQAKKFPEGPLGLILQPEQPIIEGIPEEWTALWKDLKDGKKTLTDIQNEAYRLLLETKKPETANLLTK